MGNYNITTGRYLPDSAVEFAKAHPRGKRPEINWSHFNPFFSFFISPFVITHIYLKGAGTSKANQLPRLPDNLFVRDSRSKAFTGSHNCYIAPQDRQSA